MFRTIIFKISFVSIFAAFAPLFLIALPSRRLLRRLLVTLALGVLWFARVIAGIKYKVHNNPYKNHAGDGPRPIVACKHMSVLETAFLMAYVPNVFFILKREITWIPIYGWVAARLGFIPVNRASGATNMQKLTHAAAKNVARGMTLAIFPEGTRKVPGAPIKLKRGLMFIAENLKLPIQPVGTDSGLYWPKHGKMHPGTANFWFEPILPYNATLEDIADAISRHSA
ncbi:MAG: 1-acyl-sn-glycerol-3-phosphate acyltransferase [Alphaproteobacteria bacterium]|nr:1-acyl-sn-glycerol-3-phosphate acyltransferase [Alphaproteobacteria bacterium]